MERVRIDRLRKSHRELFGPSDEVAVACAPGRAEILGSHTDYNGGLTLSTNVSRNLLIAATPRNDDIVRIASHNENLMVTEFDASSADMLLQTKSEAGSQDRWTNYVKGTLWAYAVQGIKLRGFDAVIESDIPAGAGLSSSAALETAISRIVVDINNLPHTPHEQVEFARTAENQYVGVPCGHLDQATVGLADGWLLINHHKSEQGPYTYETIPTELPAEYTFVVGYDPAKKHALTDGKYEWRRNICTSSLAPLRIGLMKYIDNLGDVTPDELEHVLSDNFFKSRLGRRAAFLTHVINENVRVDKASVHLRAGEFDQLGTLMTESGNSAINLYQLDEDAPELRFAYETVASRPERFGALGIRNMGGGFNATTLALVHTDDLHWYKASLSAKYKRRFGREYKYVALQPAPPAQIIE